MIIEVLSMYTNPIQKNTYKEDLIACSSYSASLKACPFLSIHSIQKGIKEQLLTLSYVFFPQKDSSYKGVQHLSHTKQGEKPAPTRLLLWNNEEAYDQLTLLALYTSSIHSIYSNPSLANQALTTFPNQPDQLESNLTDPNSTQV